MTDVTLIMYHYVRDFEQSKFRDIKGRSISDFATQLDYIQSKYSVISMDLYASFLRQGVEIPSNAAVLTFDDGLKDHYDYVFPELSKRNLSGVFYISSMPLSHSVVLPVHRVHHLLSEVEIEILVETYCDLLVTHDKKTADNIINSSKGITNRFDIPAVAEFKHITRLTPYEIRDEITRTLFEKYIAEESVFAPTFYLNEQEIRKMHKAGMVIGAHGHTHELMTSQSESQIVFEISQPTKMLQEIVGADISHFSFPNGRHNDTIRRLVQEAGYETAVTVQPEVNLGRVDPFQIARLDTNDIPLS